MKFINKILSGSLLVFAGLGLNSCNSFLEEYSQDLSKVNGWEDLDEVLLGAAYIGPSRYYVEGYNLYSDRSAEFDFLHFMSDEIIMTEDNGSTEIYYESMFPFITWQQDTGLDRQLRYAGGDDQYFNEPYKRINVCNMVIGQIDLMPENSHGDDVQKARVKGEAYFLRAMYYFFLANLYCEPYAPSSAASAAGLPLKFSEIIEDKEFDRASLAETYAKVLEDLSEAENLLKDVPRKSLYRADVNAVRLLQSRVYLYMQDWDNAVAKAKEVLASNGELLNIGTKAVGEACLDISSPEIIFTTGDYMIAYGFQADRGQDAPIKISDDILELFGDNDYRTERYIGETEVGHRPNVFRKVNGQNSAMGSYTTVGSNFCFRTPEAYLTLAEASAYDGDEATARQTMEKFLSSRLMGDVTVSESGADLVDLIRNERAKEFLLEGHRWFDLRRYSVCGPYPWSKEIVHGYIYISDYDYDHTDWYRLEKNDGAYTLPLPRGVRNFQVSLGNASRPDRKPFATTTVHGSSYDKLFDNNEEEGDDDDLDDDWDDDWD